MFKRRLIASIAIGSLCLTAAGCGTSAAPSAERPGKAAHAANPTAANPAAANPTATARPSAGPAAKKVSLRLQWLVAGYDDPFILAKSLGLYRKAGLDVHIGQGKASATTAQTVGNGSDTFGIVDASIAALLISKGLPIKVIADFIETSPVSFVSRQPIASPRDLIGKSVVSAAGSNPLELLPAVLAKYGISPSQVRVDSTTAATVPSVFLKNRNAVMLGVSVGNDLAALSRDPKAIVTLYAKFGVNPLSFGLVTSDREMQDHPATVRRFVAASVQGWQAAIKDPSAAVAATAKAFPHANAHIQLKGLTSSFALLHTPATKGHPLGWMAASDWSATLALLKKYGGLKNPRPVADYYTNRFLPAS